MQTHVAFQGERGAYSEEAIVSFFGEAVNAVPCKTIREVFKNTEARVVDYGVVPVENSIEGSVAETYDMFLNSSVKVSGEIILRIRHCLISLPETSLGDVKVVYSHPQALAQCRGFLTSLGVETVVTYDTAGSVKMIKEKGLKEAAAVASERAAALYGMKVLAKGVEDYGHNYTRFLVISAKEAPRQPESKTSIIFSTAHKPGALYNALGAFARNDINLTKIESRPTRQRPWEYYFFVDFEGHQDDERVRKALVELASFTTFVKVLGSYPRAHTEP
ncbi:MAG: prephenate dehydratase [Candidatus Caldarchaeum sp.]|nr:prephenate dehydratase [Candidatus Caldarchaeum sp.]MDW8359284.1 prephenate dehydratase [Candidatus Caldarchaeum sp.]